MASSSLSLARPQPLPSSYPSFNPPQPLPLSRVSFSSSSNRYKKKLLIIKASSTPCPVDDKPSGASIPKSGTWGWNFGDQLVNVHYEEHEGSSLTRSNKILVLPSISDTSTIEEWRSIAEQFISRNEDSFATIVDWPGLGFSDRPSMDYNADVMEDFLVQLVKSPDGPLANSGPGEEFVVFAAGHAATLAVRAASKKLIKPLAIAAVAPTWSGPLPIVFGRDPRMESRYGLLRGTLKTPALGWMVYNMLLSNEKAIKSQFESHVYADPMNVTPDLVKSRYELTKRKGARYVPAAFLTGLLDPVGSREQFLKLFAGLDGSIPVLVVSGISGPKRSKAEMEALRGARGVTKFVEIPGALLPHEEYPELVAEVLCRFLEEQSILKC